MNERGLSSVVASVLIILLTIIVIGMIALFASNYISNARVSAEEAKVKKDLCDSAGISADNFCWSTIPVQTLGGGESRESYLKFVANSVNPAVNISGFVIFLDYAGRSKTIPSGAFSQVEGFASNYVSTDIIDNKEAIQGIRVQPKIKSASEIVVCNGLEYSIPGSEIRDCTP